MREKIKISEYRDGKTGERLGERIVCAGEGGEVRLSWLNHYGKAGSDKTAPCRRELLDWAQMMLGSLTAGDASAKARHAGKISGVSYATAENALSVTCACGVSGGQSIDATLA